MKAFKGLGQRLQHDNEPLGEAAGLSFSDAGQGHAVHGAQALGEAGQGEDDDDNLKD